MFLLRMVAALAGTPLRISEAAHDLGRALAEDGDQGVVEVPDGGVGDDSGATIKPMDVDLAVAYSLEWLSHSLRLDPRIGTSRISRSALSLPILEDIRRPPGKSPRLRC